MTVPNDNFRRIVKDSVEAGIISGALIRKKPEREKWLEISEVS
jgi:hypothetical protein